jgi:hypothetical protein
VQLIQYPGKTVSMKRKLLWAQAIFFSLFIITSSFTLLQLSGSYNPFTRFDENSPSRVRNEEFDIALSRVNSIDKLTAYCDSLYNAQYNGAGDAAFEENYATLLSSVVSKKFYHGYSYYSFRDNYLLRLFSKATHTGYSAIVVPDDIMKYPNAACSQQAIVMMEVLKKKDIRTRKIAFKGKKYGGHFCFEVFYNGGWHFFDTNMEPDMAVLNAYDRPGIAFLCKNPEILTKAYRQYSAEEILDIFPTYTYGAVNQFPAPNGILFQKITRMLSYTLWFFFLVLFIFTRRRYRRLTGANYVWNSRVYFPPFYPGASSAYHQGYTAPGS